MRRQFKCLSFVSFVSLLVYVIHFSKNHNFVSHETRGDQQARFNRFGKERSISAEELRRETEQSCVFPVHSQSLLPCQQNNLRQTRRIIYESLPWLDLERTLNAAVTLSPGGYHQPVGCASPQRLAIIIPYRDREVNLKILLNNLHRVLQKQQAEYAIFVVEQENGTPFNRGMIKNIGYLEAKALCHFDCFTFHDVDLVTESERNTYFCGEKALHHSQKLDFLDYRTWYGNHFGGVVTFNKTYFSTINGYPNLFFMWGGEDDDLIHRLQKKQMPYEHSKYPRYTALTHKKDPHHTRQEMAVYRTSRERFGKDGLNSMERLYRHCSLLLRSAGDERRQSNTAA
ncbi:beta-1,4-N-acetylgalactosaminyltransferase bre-4-like isoform X2 [Haliotis rubra]|uniref:beta-1,4-N-acetylgalactosaminyltransferase bre-4-like isoform X2 n=1 Tax=Haliotis rubra TaxID=36100 RepID=UPI001EE61D50|nr:beta-1,4-N-acetylgalactosaminyltransferase bre-4-like isoform X2 [Haliotis rubra]